MDSKYGSGTTGSAAGAGWFTKGIALGQIVFTCHYEMGVVGGGGGDFTIGLSKSTAYEHLSYTFYKVLKITNDVITVAELEKDLLPYMAFCPSGSMNYCYARPKNQIKKSHEFPWSTYGSLILTDPGIAAPYQPWNPFEMPLLEVHGIRPPNVKVIKIDMT